MSNCSTNSTTPPAGSKTGSTPSNASSAPTIPISAPRFAAMKIWRNSKTRPGGTEMSASRTKFYLDKQNAKWSGVCSGIADYSGVDVLWVRVGAVLLTLMGGFPWTLIAYWMVAWMGTPKPFALYGSNEEAKFWQGVRSNPTASTRDIRSRLRDIDRPLADIELYYTSHNRRLPPENDSLRRARLSATGG